MAHATIPSFYVNRYYYYKLRAECSQVFLVFLSYESVGTL